MSYVHTEEQRAIIEFDYKLGQVIVTAALVGTGKTSILVDLAAELASRYPSMRGLYLCYNKANQLEAKQRFPSNVEPRTTHSLAYRTYGVPYTQKLGNPRLKHIRDVMPASIRTMDRDKSWEASSAAYEACKEFMHSDAKEPSGKCFSGYTIQRFRNAVPGMSKELQIQKLAGLAKHLWMLMCKEEPVREGGEPNLMMPHDGYLKLMELDKPTLDYDFIMFDECQDANPATLSIVLNDPRSLKIFVGDEHQQIYAFRGSKNAMKSLDPDAVLPLTGSFRFGQEIADFGSQCLNRLKTSLDKPVRIDGLGPDGKVISYKGNFIPEAKERTSISRTNATIIEHAWKCVQECVPFTIIGGADSTALKQAESAYCLWSNDKFNVKDPFMKSFEGWSSFSGYAKASKDNEALRMVGLVDEYGHQLPKIIASIRDKCLGAVPPGCAATTFTTAHKSKGMEWPCVELAGDFLSDDWFHGKYLVDVPETEANLLYVAITRAQKELKLPNDLYDALTEDLSGLDTEESEESPIKENSDLTDVNKKLDDLFAEEVNLHTNLLGSILKTP